MNAFSDLKLPKSVIAAAMAQAEKTKREISSLVASEVKEFLSKIEVDEIIRKVLAGQSIEIQASIRFADKSVQKKRPRKAAKNTKKID